MKSDAICMVQENSSSYVVLDDNSLCSMNSAYAFGLDYDWKMDNYDSKQVTIKCTLGRRIVGSPGMWRITMSFMQQSRLCTLRSP